MTVLLCFLLPPVFLMYIREKVLGSKTECNFYGDVKSFLREYLLTLCFLNFVVLAVTYKLFTPHGALDTSLMENAEFAFRYLLLSLIIAALEPVVENFLRYHLKIEINKIEIPGMKIHFNKNLILYVYAFVLFLLNFIRIFDNAFWLDEGYSIKLAKMTLRSMVGSTAADVHPPLYYLFAQILYHVFGNNGIAYHLSALLPYAVIMIMGCTVIKKYFGPIPATIMITMASLMKNAVVYNVEARMYALASMFVLIAYVAFYKIIEKNNRMSWIVFCVSSLSASYTHYYALISVAFLFVMLMPLAIFRKKYRKGLIISYLVAILTYFPWLIILLKTFGRTAKDWWLNEIPTISECSIFLLDYNWMVVCFIALLLLFVAYQIKFLVIKTSNEGELKDRVDISINIPKKIDVSGELYWVISGIISICGTAAVGLALSYLIRPFFLTRYLFPVSAMLYLIIGVCVSKMKLRRLWSTALIIAILWNNVPAYVQRYEEDYKLNNDTAMFLDAVKPEDDAEIVIDNISTLGYPVLNYYYPENDLKYDLDASKNLDTNYEDIWIIWRGELDETAENNIREQQYTSTKIYEGNFADGLFYHVYKLHRNN